MPSPPKIKRQLPEPTNSFRQGTSLEFHRCVILIAPSLANKRSASTTELNVHNMAKVISIAAHCNGRVVLHHLQLTAERKTHGKSYNRFHWSRYYGQTHGAKSFEGGLSTRH